MISPIAQMIVGCPGMKNFSYWTLNDGDYCFEMWDKITEKYFTFNYFRAEKGEFQLNRGLETNLIVQEYFARCEKLLAFQ